MAEIKKYAGKNIRTQDKTIAYVTKDGLVKGYTDMDVFTATAGMNGCPLNSVQLTDEWNTLGAPLGSVMAKGQSCGLERSYVTSDPPETNFDPVFYKKEYSDVSSMTNEQATAHWDSIGKKEGRLPNGNIMKSMTAMGQVGYIDFDTVVHKVPASSIQYGEYKIYKQRSNITGAAMMDCTPGTGINYADRVVLNFGSQMGSIQSAVLKFGTSSTPFFVRPPPRSVNKAIHYGDTLTLAQSITTNSATCGYWGCNVSFVNPDSKRLEFGPGGALGGTQLKLVAPTGYTEGGPLRYGAQFMLTTTVAAPDYALFQGKTLVPGKSITSASSQYYVTFTTDGRMILYEHTNKEIFSSKLTDSNPRTLSLNGSGSLVATNADGEVYWSTDTNGKGTPPYAFAVQDDGRAVLYDSQLAVIWSTGTASGPSSMKLQTLYATVSSGNIVFAAVDAKTTFTFTNPDTDGETQGCDVLALKQQCGADCLGFVHNPATNEWQPMKTTEPTSFGIAPTMQDIYLKTPAVTMDGKTLSLNDSAYLNASTFANFQKGPDLKTSDMTADNALFKAADYLHDASTQHSNELEAAYAAAQEKANQYRSSDLADRIKNYASTGAVMQSKMTQYQNALSTLEKGVDTKTFEKQRDDSSVIDRQRKAQFVIWAVAVAAILGLIVVVLKKK
jgi:hypothetical protein